MRRPANTARAKTLLLEPSWRTLEINQKASGPVTASRRKPASCPGWPSGPRCCTLDHGSGPHNYAPWPETALEWQLTVRSGKSLLAFLTNSEIKAYLDQQNSRLHSKYHSKRDVLQEELERPGTRIRRQQEIARASLPHPFGTDHRCSAISSARQILGRNGFLNPNS